MISVFWFGESASSRQHLHVFIGDEVVDRRDVAIRDRGTHHLGRLGLGLHQTLAHLGVPERGLLSTFGFEDLRLLLAFSLQDCPLAQTLSLQDLGALLALRLHLAAHRLHQVGRRHDVLDLDAVDLDAPGRHRNIDHARQPVH